VLERERQEAITRLIRQNRFLSIGEVVDALGVSEATARRDLTRLEHNGVLRRVRGGAEVAGDANPADRGADDFDALERELPFESRKAVNRELKRRIARRAASLCRNGETIIIDGGSTTYQMAPFLTELELVVITNSFAIAQYLLEHSASKIIIPEGVVFRESQLILSPFHQDVVSNYFASKVFMGVEGLDSRGATNTNMMLIQAERAMIDHANDLVIVADSSKFRTQGHLRLCGYDRISTIITDGGITDDEREMVRSAGVELIEA
jgi:DeoR family ulaG and ulaABCDEF operon transcriptional repressor